MGGYAAGWPSPERSVPPRRREGVACGGPGRSMPVPAPPPPPVLDDREPARDQRQCLVVVPAPPVPHLIVAQPRPAPAPLQALLDPAAPPGHLRESLRRRRPRGLGGVKIIPPPTSLLGTPRHQRLLEAHHPQPPPSIPRSVRRSRLPAAPPPRRGPSSGATPPPAATRTRRVRPGTDARAAATRPAPCKATPGGPSPHRRRSSRAPAPGRGGRASPTPTRRAYDREPLGDPALPPTSTVPGPFGGQVEPEVDQDVLGLGGVAQVDADMAVRGPARPAAPLPLHPDGGAPLLGEGREAEGEHGVGVARAAGHLAVQFVDQRRVIPGGGAEERPERLPVEVMPLGDGLGVHVLDVGEGPGEVEPGVHPALGARGSGAWRGRAGRGPRGVGWRRRRRRGPRRPAGDRPARGWNRGPIARLLS
jgi:hypothetical protein